MNGLLDSTTSESATDSRNLATEHLTHLLEVPRKELALVAVLMHAECCLTAA